MSIVLEDYCSGCEKENQPFTTRPHHARSLVCDRCVAKEETNKRAKRLQDLRIIAQDWESLADLLLGLEERVKKLESRRVF